MIVLPPPNVAVVGKDGLMTQLWYKFFSDLMLTNQPILNTAYIDLTEITAPAAGAALHARLFAQDNGGGKVQLAALFPTGVVQPIVTEP